MKFKTFSESLLLMFMLLACALGAKAEDAPLWVQKNVEHLQKQRTSDSYDFVKFHTWDFQKERALELARQELVKYVESNYGATPRSVVINECPEGGPSDLEVSYSSADGGRHVLTARLVDTFTELKEYELNVYQFEYYELFALSKPDVEPVFDTFSLSSSYRGEALLQSLVPGMGQLYKGQKTKAFVIMGGEVFFIGAALYFNYKAHDAHKMRTEDPDFADSWRSKERGWKNFRLGAWGCAAALYIYNLVDAATSKGARHVSVSAPKKGRQPSFSLMPYAEPDNAGLAFNLTF